MLLKSTTASVQGSILEPAVPPPLAKGCERIQETDSSGAVSRCADFCFKDDKLDSAILYADPVNCSESATSLKINDPAKGDPDLYICSPCGESALSCSACDPDSPTCFKKILYPRDIYFKCDLFKYSDTTFAGEVGQNSPVCFRDKYGRSVCTP
jgi:hypothetical protein